MTRNTKATRALLAKHAQATAAAGWLQDGEAGMRRFRIIPHSEGIGFWTIVFLGASLAGATCVALRGLV